VFSLLKYIYEFQISKFEGIFGRRSGGYSHDLAQELPYYKISVSQVRYPPGSCQHKQQHDILAWRVQVLLTYHHQYGFSSKIEHEMKEIETFAVYQRPP
jgi:hypothetical protein